MKRPEPLDEGGLQALLGYRLARAGVVTRQAFDAEVRTPLGLRPVAFSLLALIAANPGASARQLGTALALSPPSITQWLDQLEARALVRRERSATDGRAQAVHATREGGALVRRAMARLRAAEARALPMLSDAERAILLELLARVAGTPPAARLAAAGADSPACDSAAPAPPATIRR